MIAARTQATGGALQAPCCTTTHNSHALLIHSIIHCPFVFRVQATLEVRLLGETRRRQAEAEAAADAAERLAAAEQRAGELQRQVGARCSLLNAAAFCAGWCRMNHLCAGGVA